MDKIKRAILSVSDKRGIVEFASGLREAGFKIISTGKTAQILQEHKIEVEKIEDYTGFPEMMDGRLKTLHPRIHGGILALRERQSHLEDMRKEGIEPIDMVVVNLYPFEETVSRQGVTLEEAIENVDIGGPTMLRAAAKNWQHVVVVCDPFDYSFILKDLKEGNGEVSLDTRFFLAKKVFERTARYDGAISNYLSSLEGDHLSRFPSVLNLQYYKIQELRYGENPHQSSSFYKESGWEGEGNLASSLLLQGKELSFNNILDLDCALSLTKEFEETFAVIIKHQNPCGAAISRSSLKDAYLKARECDPLSAFGGVIGLNRTVDSVTAKEIVSTFMEALIAPDYDDGALAILKERKDLRVLRTGKTSEFQRSAFDLKRVAGGILMQDRDLDRIDVKNLEAVTKRSPTEEEIAAMDFAWKISIYVKSNAIVYGGPDRLLGVGAGQMSRIDSANFGAGKALSSLKGAVLASDGMLPFRDTVDLAASHGVTAIIQPGGSVKDEEVISACNEHGMAMVFTRMRHFRH